MDSGIYKVLFTPVDGYAEKDTTNIEVTIGTVTDLGTINLERN